MQHCKTILVVGGAGYIGSHTVKLLLSLGYHVIVFDNLSTGHAESVPADYLMIGDLSNQSELDACFKNHKIDLVMHFASSISVGESVVDPAKYYKNNVIHSIHLLEAMRTHSVKKIVFSSTAAVYGYPKTTPIGVDHEKKPMNPYGKSKLMLEEIIKDYAVAYQIQYVFLRYFNAAGADPSGDIGELHDPETHLIPLALQVASGRKKQVDVFGSDYPTNDGTCIRDYVHVCDIARAHELSAQYLFNDKPSRDFNLGTGVGYSVKEVIDTVKAVTGKELTVSFSDRRAGDPPCLVADNIEATRLLQWKIQYASLKEIIQHAWLWELLRCNILSIGPR